MKYNETKRSFDDALNREDKLKAQEAYEKLDKMLHPQYPLRPVFKMQLDKILGGEK